MLVRLKTNLDIAEYIANVYSSQNVFCLGLCKPVCYVCVLFCFQFSSLLFVVLDFVWYFVGQHLRDIFMRCTTNQRNERKRERKTKHRFKMHAQLKCGESFSATHKHTHTYFLSKWNLLLLDIFSVAPYHFNGNYNLIASFNIIMGHRQHVNGISIICTTYRIEENTRAKERERGENGGLKCKLRLFGILMGWQWQSLSLCVGIDVDDNGVGVVVNVGMAVAVQRAILFILNSTTNFNGQFMKCRSK